MFQKIFLLTLCLILSACGNTEAPSKTVSSVHTSSKIETFESNYARIIESTLSLSSTGLFSVLQDFSSSLSPSGYDTSVIRVAFGIPKKTSGDISLGADAIRETYKKLSAKISLTGSLTNMSGEIISLQDIR